MRSIIRTTNGIKPLGQVLNPFSELGDRELNRIFVSTEVEREGESTDQGLCKGYHS